MKLITAVTPIKKNIIISLGNSSRITAGNSFDVWVTIINPRKTKASEFKEINSFEKNGILFSLKGGSEYK